LFLTKGYEMDTDRIEDILDDAKARFRGNRKRVQQSQSNLVAAATDMGGMAEFYGPLFAKIDTAAAAAPGDTVLQHHKARKDKMVTEIGAFKTFVETIRDELIAHDVSGD
jgi:hypothetical protein